MGDRRVRRFGNRGHALDLLNLAVRLSRLSHGLPGADSRFRWRRGACGSSQRHCASPPIGWMSPRSPPVSSTSSLMSGTATAIGRAGHFDYPRQPNLELLAHQGGKRIAPALRQVHKAVMNHRMMEGDGHQWPPSVSNPHSMNVVSSRMLRSNRAFQSACDAKCAGF